MTDRKLLCGDCGKEFVFTAAEQEFFKERGFDHDPKRCAPCRKQRRRRSRSGGPRASQGSHGPRRGHAPGAGGQGRVGGASRQRPPPAPESLHDAVCSACGSETKVPFEPDGVRPVYCMACLKQRTR